MSQLSPLRRAFTAPHRPLQFIRHESSARRTKKRLRIGPDPSFEISATSPAGTHIIYNPPAAAPTPRQTPALFLPKSDPRKTSGLGVPLAPVTELPPPVRAIREKKYHLGPKEFEEIRRLRLEDPKKYSRAELARKFNCSSLFIGMICEAPESHKAEMKAQLEEVKRGWGEQRRQARADARRRLEGQGGADGLGW